MSASRRPASRNLDLSMVVLLGLLVVGGHLLVWADNEGLVSGNQLFSVWALPVYLGFLPAAYVLFLWWSGRRRGGGMPLGYRAALAGAALFFLSLIADLAWNSVYGRPAGPEGVLAPSRIGLFVGSALMVSGPLLSLVRRMAADGDLPRRINSIGAVAVAVALGLLLSLATLLTGFVHPFVVDAGAPVDQRTAETPTDLYLVPIDGTGAQRLTTTPTEWEAHPDVDSHGNLAYARGQLENFRVYLDEPDASQPVRLDPRETHQDGPVFSDDDATVSFWAALEQPEPAPTPSGPGPAPGPSQQPQQRLDLGDLSAWLAHQDTGTIEQLDSQPAEGVEAWSHDGNTLCGWTIADGTFDIELWNANSRNPIRTIIAAESHEWGCDFAADDARVYFHSDRDGDWDIYSIALDGSDLRQITDDPGIDQWPHLSPDGNQLAWMSSRGGELDIWLGTSTGNAAQDLTNDPSLEDGYYGFAWLPDGSGLVAASAGRSYAAPDAAETQPLGVGAIVLNALIVVGVLLFGLRLVGPMVGMGTIVGLINGLLAALVGGEPLFFVSVLAAGIAADLVFLRGATISTRRLAVTVAGASAFVLVLSYFLLLMSGVGWGLDLVLGSIILSVVLAMGLALILTWESADSPATVS